MSPALLLPLRVHVQLYGCIVWIACENRTWRDTQYSVHDSHDDSVSVYAHWHVLYCQCVLQSLIQPA